MLSTNPHDASNESELTLNSIDFANRYSNNTNIIMKKFVYFIRLKQQARTS